MLRWLWTTLLTVGWYALVAGGWYLWLRARYKVHQLESELTRMAHALRYTQERRSP